MPDKPQFASTILADYLSKVRESLQSPQAESKGSLDPFQQADLEDKKAELDDKIANTELKKRYAKWFIWILIVQLAVMNVIFFMVGKSCLQYNDPAYLKIYMSGTLAEVFGVVLVITRYLFSKKN